MTTMQQVVKQPDGTHLQDGRWMWAPDYSNVIDVQSFPGARWYQGEPGGGDSVEIKAGFYRPAKRREREDQTAGLVSFWPDQSGAQAFMPVSQWQRQEMTDGGSVNVQEPPTYRQLKEAGLWNLADQNSPTWGYLNSLAGGRDVRNDTSAMYQALTKSNPELMTGVPIRGDSTPIPGMEAEFKAAYESNLRGMLEGVAPTFLDQFAPAASQAQFQYNSNIDDSTSFRDVAKGFAEIFTQVPPLAIAAAAFTGGASLAAGGSAGFSAALAGAQTGALQGLAQEGDFGDALTGAITGGVTGGALGAGSEYLFGGPTPGGSLADLNASGGGTAGTSGLSQADLAALIESGTVGFEGAALEGLAGIGGGMTAADLAQLIESGTVGDAGAQLEGMAGIGSGAGGMTAAELAQLIEGGTVGDAGAALETAALSGPLSLPSAVVPQAPPISTTDLTASVGGTAPASTPANMPPAVPEVDPTFGRALTQTGAGQFENLGNTETFGAIGGGGGSGIPVAAVGAGAAAVPSAGGGSSTGGTSPTTTTGGGTALGRILSGNGTLDDYLSVLGQAAPAALGALGADRMADLYKEQSDRYFNMGAPYRSRLEATYADPSAYLTSPEVTVPVQQGTDALARALSVQGNPAGSGTALHELQNYASNQLFGRLGQERDRLAGFGGMTAYNSAAPGAANNAIGAQRGIYDAIGAGAADVFNPRPRPISLSDIYNMSRGGTMSLA